MKLTVLGCGDAFGNGGRNNTSFLLSKNEQERILVDCGASTLIGLKREKIDLETISVIILTHFHGDHFGGIPFFLLSSAFENPRKSALTIIGPEGVKERVFELQEAMYKGSLDKLSKLKVNFIEYNSKEDMNFDDQLLISAIEVDHSLLSNPHALRIEWEGKVFAFSGDTSWKDSLITLSNDADLFICECNFSKGTHFGHLSYEELLNKKDQLRCKQLFLSHMNDEVINDNNMVINNLSDGMKFEF